MKINTEWKIISWDICVAENDHLDRVLTVTDINTESNSIEREKEKEKATVNGNMKSKTDGKKPAKKKVVVKKAGKAGKTVVTLVNKNEKDSEAGAPLDRANTMPEKQKTKLSMQDASKVQVNVYIPGENTKVTMQDTLTKQSETDMKVGRSRTVVGTVRPPSETMSTPNTSEQNKATVKVNKPAKSKKQKTASKKKKK